MPSPSLPKSLRQNQLAGIDRHSGGFSPRPLQTLRYFNSSWASPAP